MSDRVTIDGLLQLAKTIDEWPLGSLANATQAQQLARAVIDLLGASQPCGHDDAEVTMYRGEPRVTVPIGADRFMFDVDTLRQLCVGWLRVCDAADAKRGGEAG